MRPFSSEEFRSLAFFLDFSCLDSGGVGSSTKLDFWCFLLDLLVLLSSIIKAVVSFEDFLTFSESLFLEERLLLIRTAGDSSL